jgi:hypothetical protein
LSTAGALIVLAATAFAIFCVLTCREERESLAIGEAYDSIGSDYLPFIVIAIGALLVAVGVMIFWVICKRHKTQSWPQSLTIRCGEPGRAGSVPLHRSALLSRHH